MSTTTKHDPAGDGIREAKRLAHIDEQGYAIGDKVFHRHNHTTNRRRTMDAERYADDRIADLTRSLAACLTPDTLDSLIHDISVDSPHPIPEDLQQFVFRMTMQRKTL